MIKKRSKKKVFADIKTLVNERRYKSNFDFEKYGISEKDKRYVEEREEIILENVQKHAQSLYEICKAIYEIRLALNGDDSTSFRDWYQQNGLSKDKVSELTKRYELYIQAPDQIEFISELSIPAVKELTKKHVDIITQIEAIESGLNRVEDIKEFVAVKQPEDKTAVVVAKKKPKKWVEKFVRFYEKNIQATTDPHVLREYKQEIRLAKQCIREIEEKINALEEQKARDNNMTIYDVEEAEIV